MMHLISVGDLLVGHYSSLTHVSNLENIKIGAQLQIACTHCGNHLGGAQPTPSNCDITSTGGNISVVYVL